MALSEEHRELLRTGSGLIDSVIDARGYRSVPADELVKLVMDGVYDSSAAKSKGAIGIPVYRPDGDVHCEQLRLDHAIGERKYLWPNNVRNALDVYPGHLQYIDDPSITLVICEGTKKADAIVSHIPEGEKLCVVAINGCWGWRSKVKGRVSVALPDFQDIALDGRLIITVPDSDYYTNPNVKRGWQGLAEYGASKTKDNKMLECVVPSKGLEKQGADDYLLEHTLEELFGYARSIDFAFEKAAPDLQWSIMGDILKEEDTVEWLVTNLIPAGGITLMVGHSRSYKTWNALRLCLDLLLGRNIWEHPELTVAESADVLYINMEMVRAMVKARMQDMLLSPDLQHEGMEELLDEHFGVLDNKVFDLKNPDHQAWLIENIRINGTRLAVIDTFSMVWQGNENDATEIGQFFKILRMISELTGVAWLVLHHFGKPSQDTHTRSEMFAVRGSGQLVQQADSGIAMEVISEGDETVMIKMSQFKSRSSAELHTWINEFTRPEDTKARDVKYRGPYNVPPRGKSRVAQEEGAVIDMLLSQEHALEHGIVLPLLLALTSGHEVLQNMGLQKVSKQLREHVKNHVLEFDAHTQTYIKGEMFDAVRASGSAIE